MTLQERIFARIEVEGGISVADYMELCLADPQEGYYMTGTPLGLDGDFVTAPEISQIFGELLGIWMAECWRMLGRPRADLVELGPGMGTLMEDFLRATRHVPGFHDSIDVHLVETSPRLRELQRRKLEGTHPRIDWHKRLPHSERPLLVLGNEFFDALPIAQYVTVENGFRERIVLREADSDALAFDMADHVLRKLPSRYPAIAAGELPEGCIVEICPLAQEIMEQIAQRIAAHGGAALFADYGYTRPDDGHVYAQGDTFQAIKGHKNHDPLVAPGSADLTAHVDFSTLAQVAVAAGGYAPPVLTQSAFLHGMGGGLRLQQLLAKAESEDIRATLRHGYHRLTAPEEMGELFKLLAVTPAGVPAPIFAGEALHTPPQKEES